MNYHKFVEGILPDFVDMDEILFSYEFKDFVSVRTTHKYENAQNEIAKNVYSLTKHFRSYRTRTILKIIHLLFPFENDFI